MAASHPNEESMDTSETIDVEDDDVVITGEDKAISKTADIDEISKRIVKARQTAEDIESHSTFIQKELERMESDMSHAVFRSLKFLMEKPSCTLQLSVNWAELEKMIYSILEELRQDQTLDINRSGFLEYSSRFTHIEKQNQAVSKIFLDSHAKLKQIRKNLTEESKAIEKEIQQYESYMLIEDDNDVTIVGDPNDEPLQSSDLSPAAVTQPLPPMEQLRSQFASAVSKSMPTLLNSLQQPPKTPTFEIQTSPQIQNTGSLPIKWPDLNVGDKVLGKKFNDVWYSGTVLDVIPKKDTAEWRCKVKFDRKGLKSLGAKHVAYREPLNCFIRVGTRIVALYREDDRPSSFYAGVIAEAPSVKNNKRFLVFFDDGYAQYCEANELHKVFKQSANVWEDIHPDTSAFIKEYLRIYPERPMVRLSKGQVVRTEWNGKWWTAKVQEADSSLVKMYFQADKRTEWLYRGSTRLEPLYKALANADAIKAAGTSRGRRHNLNMRPSDASKKPLVEYTRNTGEEENSSGTTPSPRSKASSSNKVSSDAKKKSNVAKKSTGGSINSGSDSTSSSTSKWEPPWVKYQRKAHSGHKKPSESAPQQGSVGVSVAVDKEKIASPLQSSKHSKDIASVLHDRLATSQVEYDMEKATGERKETIIEQKKASIPFKPHLCTPNCVTVPAEDPDKFKGRSSLLIPLLCGWERQVYKAKPTAKRYVLYCAPCGRRLRCLEEVDKYLMWTDSKLLIDLFCFDHQLHVNTEFVPVKTFCDIKDLSYGIENYPISCVNGVDRQYPDYVEYENHRIPSTGVHLNLDPDFLVCCDCTDNCRDKSKCACQQMTINSTSWIGDVDSEAGYQHKRLQEPLFTGIVECNSRCKCDKRCLNRVAQFGLKCRLQVFRTEKKGWGLRCLDDIAKGSFLCIYAGQLLTDKGANEDGKQYGDEYLAELDFIEVVERQKEGYESDVENMSFSDDETDVNYKRNKNSEDDSDYSLDYTSASRVQRIAKRRKSRHEKKDSNQSDKEKNDSNQSDKEKNDSNQSDKDKTTKNPEEKKVNDPGPVVTSMEDPINISDDDDDDDEEETEVDKKTGSSNSEEKELKDTTTANDEKRDDTKLANRRPRAKKSTGGSRFNLSTSIRTTQEPISENKTEKKERLPTRSFFQDGTECYIMDAKSMGNLGRYLNHSCSPNVFVQNIFVDTHDLRFPWVAFFAGQYIRAGTELTWDYNYEVGSVPDKVLYCYCGSPTCRGRLL